MTGWIVSIKACSMVQSLLSCKLNRLSWTFAVKLTLFNQGPKSLATAWRYLRLYIIRCCNHFLSKVKDPLLENLIALCMDIETSSSVMAGLGKDNIDTLLLTTPPCLIGTIVVFIHAWDGRRYRRSHTFIFAFHLFLLLHLSFYIWQETILPRVMCKSAQFMIQLSRY